MSIPESGVPNIETDELGARRSRARALVNGSEGERLPEFEREVLHRWANLGWNEDEIARKLRVRKLAVSQIIRLYAPARDDVPRSEPRFGDRIAREPPRKGRRR